MPAINNNSKYFNFPLRKDQDLAFKILREYTDIKDKKVFILKGYAGTGKTTLAGGLVTCCLVKVLPIFDK